MVNDMPGLGRGVRRVGAIEGALHMVAGGVLLAAGAGPGRADGFAGALAGWWLLAGLVYATMRLSGVRQWIGRWDVPSFLIVWGYVLVTAIGTVAVAVQWGG